MSLYVVLWVIASAIWGSAFLFLRWSLESFPPLTTVALRLSTGLVALLISDAVLLATGTLDRAAVRAACTWKRQRALCALGVANTVLPVVCVSYGEKYINAGIASIFVASTPVWTEVLLRIFRMSDEANLCMLVCGFVVGLVGLVGIVVDDLIKPADEAVPLYEQIFGHVLLIACALSYGVGAVLARKYAAGLHPAVAATGQVLYGALAAIVIALPTDGLLPPDAYPRHLGFFATATPKAWIGCIYQGIGSTCIGFFIYFFLVKKLGPARVMMAWMTFPIYGVLEGALFLQEWKGKATSTIAIQCVGSVLVIVGLVVVFQAKRMPKRLSEKTAALLPSDDPDNASLNMPLDAQQAATRAAPDI